MFMGFLCGNENKLLLLSLLTVVKYHHCEFSDTSTNTRLHFTHLFSIEKGVSHEV